jgi:alkylglycerol monooxygenase
VDARYIALAVPFFLLLIGVELGVNRRQGDLRYTFHDAITSIGCGVGQQVLGVFMLAVRVGGYALVYEHLRVATLSPRSPLAWLALLFAVDLGYYAYHRASHRVAFFWATHIVHHQSEEYNLSTALRQSWFTGLTSWLFYLPLAVFGFPPVMYVAMVTLNTLFQFWIHTRAVGRLGWLELVLNTPSHHRVHHGINPKYIDRNYAGVFILWDRLFGTFKAEEEEPVYGTVQPLRSFNPLWANVEHWVELWGRARRTRRLRDKLLVWVTPPEWRSADLGGPVVVPEVSGATRPKYATAAPRGLDTLPAGRLRSGRRGGHGAARVRGRAPARAEGGGRGAARRRPRLPRRADRGEGVGGAAGVGAAVGGRGARRVARAGYGGVPAGDGRRCGCGARAVLVGRAVPGPPAASRAGARACGLTALRARAFSTDNLRVRVTGNGRATTSFRCVRSRGAARNLFRP